MTTPGVDFFRLDRGRPTKRLLTLAGLFVATGGTVVGAHLMHRLSSSDGALLSLAGGITLMIGLLVGFGTMAMFLFENIWVALRDEGLVLHDNGEETVIAWADLGDVTIDEGGVLVLGRAEKEAVRWYAGGSAKTIAARIDEARRRGKHGLPLNLVP